MPDRLDALYRGFREALLPWDALLGQVHAWAEAFPHLVRVDTIGTSGAGRDLVVLALGPEPDRTRPAVWVDANIHASELAGSSVALAIAEDVLRVHLGGTPHDLPEHVCEVLREVLVYVMPRVSPDGAEEVLTTRRYVRSVPRDGRAYRTVPRWVSDDVDGDGLVLVMRQEDPCGDFAVSREVDGLLVPRELEDEGPFYRLYPEGTIEGWDGVTIPPPHMLGDNEPDLNRNFPYSWASEPQQYGAGRWPASEPESLALVQFADAHPHLFVWLAIHTFGGVLIRPLGDGPDKKLDEFDLGVFRQLEAWATRYTGYPTVSGFEQFTYQPDKPLHGDVSDWAFNVRGCVSWVVELWDLFEQVGLPSRPRFVDRYSQLDREHLEAIGRWDGEHNDSRVLRPWRPFHHPQLGPVEVGGIDPLVGMWNPPPDRLPEVCAGQAAVFLRMAALCPRLKLGIHAVEPLGADLWRVRVAVENQGYLPTFGTGAGRPLPFNEAPYAELDGDSVEPARQEVGHLTGWGRGRWTGGQALFFSRSNGSTCRKVLTWTVRGAGAVRVRVGSSRVGFVDVDVPLEATGAAVEMH